LLGTLNKKDLMPINSPEVYIEEHNVVIGSGAAKLRDHEEQNNGGFVGGYSLGC